MSKYVKFFKDIGKNDAPEAGGKGASLGEMTNAKIPVPPGFVILSSGFEYFLAENDLVQEIHAIIEKVNHKEIESVERASEEIKELVMRGKMPKSLEKEIRECFTKLDAKFVAVRSSATAEDGKEHAWAGQLDTFLNTTSKGLEKNIKRCFASLFTPRAIFYRFEKGLHKTHISVAVVVQKMVNSEKSGIAFSVHPVTEDKNQIIIEGSWGLGEAIVSGQVTPDSYVVEKTPRNILDINISEKSRGIFKKAAGGSPSRKASAEGANEWKNISAKKASKQCLTGKEILELTELILGIEKHYGFPCDIEWAFEKKKFYITQSRPITTLK
ncbi:MAG TPA: PEP/pyruvate-binding domain-containing protein [Candidatus Paceibacterota bacterium]